MWNHLLDLFINHTCFGCNKELTIQEPHICMACISQMEQTYFHHKATENALYYRIAGKVRISGASSLFYFDKGGNLQRILQSLKYHHAPQLGYHLGELYGHTLNGTSFLNGIDCIIPVPLHSIKKKKRGYNQAEVIANGLSRVTGIAVDTSILKRSYFTSTQTQHARKARWENTIDAFQATRHSYQHILIIDDVITTGATIEGCVSAFEKLSIEDFKISIASIAMARRSE